jgi:hypothetical protein
MSMQVWLVHHNVDDYRNVVVTADSREMAKRVAEGVLEGNPDTYVVTPVTERGSHTTLIVAAEVVKTNVL